MYMLVYLNKCIRAFEKLHESGLRSFHSRTLNLKIKLFSDTYRIYCRVFNVIFFVFCFFFFVDVFTLLCYYIGVLKYPV